MLITSYISNNVSQSLRNGRIDKYLFEEGYCQAEANSSTKDRFTFCYYDRDHLGSARQVTEADGSKNGYVIQTANYYPFGGELCQGDAKNSVQPYKYNGKEFDNMYGLNTYDYGARQYNPVTGRWDRMDQLCEKYYPTSPFAYCMNNPVRFIDPDGKQPVKYIDSNGRKNISWSVVIMVKAPKEGASQKNIIKHETQKQRLKQQYMEQFNHFLNGDGDGALNSAGERILSEFNIHVIDVRDPSSKEDAKKLSKEYSQDIKDQQGRNGDAAVFMDGSTGGAQGNTNRAAFITIAETAPEGTESHELFHTSGIGDNGYQSGGVLNCPPNPIIPAEVDQLWGNIPERK